MVKKPLTTNGRATSRQIKAARAWLDLSQDELAAASKVGRRSIQDFESGNRELHERTLRDLQKAIEERGIEFLFSGDRAVGIRERDPE